MTREILCAKSIASTLRKNEKALETLRSKNARPWQIEAVAAAVSHHRAMLAAVEGRPVGPEQAEAALSAIPTYVKRIEKILPKFQPGTSQHTLAVRRLDAYALAAGLLGQLKQQKGGS